MSFFAILFALLIEQVRPLAQHNPVHAGLRVWARSVSRNFDAGKAHHGWVAWSLAVLLPSAAALGVYWLLDWLAGWPFAMLWSVAVLYTTLGFRQFSHHFTGIRDALDCYCTGTNWCYVAAHSAGNLQIGYALSLYGTSSRSIKTPTPNSAGQCSNSGAGTQTGWNIKWVDVAGGAAGGSELADAGDWALSEPLVSDLKTSTARAMYDHSTTRSVWFYNFAGAAGTLYSAVLPGQDDEVVAYHSSGGVSGSAGGSYCNPSDWFCNDLNLSTSACEGGTPKWGYHSLAFRDDSESANHYGAGTWSGIISPMRTDTVNHAG